MLLIPLVIIIFCFYIWDILLRIGDSLGVNTEWIYAGFRDGFTVMKWVRVDDVE